MNPNTIEYVACNKCSGSGVYKSSKTGKVYPNACYPCNGSGKIVVAKPTMLLDSNFKKVPDALVSASEKGIRYPTLRTENFIFTLAKRASHNPGFVYIKSNAERLYLGKISPAGEFYPIKDLTVDLLQKLEKMAKNPLEAAITYGHKTGRCSCCGRQLDNAESIQLGIGPICRERYFV